MATANAVRTEVSAAEVERLRERFRGPLLRPGDPGYDEARVIWNAIIDRRPAIIARCTGVADVVAAVNFAREGGYAPAIRGGGHGAAGYAMADGDLVIDLSPMKGVRVDPDARRARAEAGCTWGDLDHETQAFALATPGGAVSDTGVAGLTLGGGIGWLSRAYGLTCDNLVSADVVMADGRVLVASPDEHDDLFWALRGGGGNFGVVTSFEFQLHPVGPLVIGGVLLFTMDRAQEILRFYREFAKTCPETLGMNLFVVHAQPMPGLPSELEWEQVVALGICWPGDHEEGMAILQPWRDLWPALDFAGPIPYVALQSMQDVAGRAGRHSYWKSSYMAELTDDAIDVYLDWCREVPSRESVIELNTLGGAIAGRSSEETAFHQRGGRFNHCIVCLWPDPRDTERNVGYARRFFEAMTPYYTGGVYSNFLSLEGEGRVRAAYSDESWARLTEIKRRYDPGNLFRRNHNIPPLEVPG